MKILMPMDSTPSGSGGSQTVMILARGLVKKGFEVKILHPSDKEGLILDDGVEIESFKWDMKGGYLAKRELMFLMKTPYFRKKMQECDLVHTQVYFTALPFLFLKRFNKKPVVSTIRDSWPVCFHRSFMDKKTLKYHFSCSFNERFKCLHGIQKLYNPYIELIQRENKWLLNGADRIICMSSFVKSYMGRAGYKHLEVIPNSIDINEWTEKVSWFPKLLPKKTKPVVLYLGTDSWFKGSQYVEQAAMEYKEMDFWFVGYKKPDYENMHFFGKVYYNEIPSIINNADIVVVPSLIPESISRVCLEAFALKKPVITTNNGGNGDIVEHMKSGIHVHASSEAIIHALRRLEDEETRRRFGQAGYEKVKNDFNVEKVVEEHIRVYNEATNKIPKMPDGTSIQKFAVGGGYR